MNRLKIQTVNIFFFKILEMKKQRCILTLKSEDENYQNVYIAAIPCYALFAIQKKECG